MRNPTLLIIRKLSFALAICVLTAEIVQAAPIASILDKRVITSGSFSQLISSDWWQSNKQTPTDYSQQLRGCQSGMMNTPGGYNAHRARNLAACDHYAEAIGEWTRAIDSFDDHKTAIVGMSLEPDWLLNRARLYLVIGRPDDALADIERSLTLKRASDQSKFAAAVLLMEMDKFSRAETVSPDPSSGSPYFKPYYSYLRGLVQQRLSKKDQAKQNFMDGARYFAASGATGAAQSCLDAIAKLDGPTAKTSLTMSKVEAPKSNYDNILRLLKALTSRPDVFDIEVLKGLTGVTTFKEIETGYLVMPYGGHFKELALVKIDKQKTGGKKLYIQLQPELCSINRAELKGLLKNPVAVPDIWNKDLVESEGFKVPSGTLVLNTRKGPFNSIWLAQLYSKDAIFPEPPQRPIVENDKSERNLRNLHAVISAIEMGDFKGAQPAVTELLSDDPENPRINMYQAEIYFKTGKINEALASIDVAIKYGDKDKLLNDKYSGNTLLIHKGTYLLEQGKFDEAYKDFVQAFPAKPYADQLILKARSEIGLKMYSKAAKDLNEASIKYYDEGRIVKRDEAYKLLESIRGNISDSEVPVNQIVPVTEGNRIKAMDSERAKTATIMRSVQDERQQRNDAKSKRERELVEKAAEKLIAVTAFKQSKQGEYIRALLDMSVTAKKLGQREIAQNYWDKAFESYESYEPPTENDACTRTLITNLNEFDGLQFQKRFENLARRSELFCKSEKFQRERDESFLDLARAGEPHDAMLEKLIAIREELQPKTGIAANMLNMRVPKTYKGKGAYKGIEEYFQQPSRYTFANQNPSVESSTLFSAISQLLVTSEKIFTCIDRDDLNESQKLIEKLQQQPEKQTEPVSFYNAPLRSTLIAIANKYADRSKGDLADLCLRKAVAIKFDTTPDLETIRELLSKLRTEFEDSKQFAKAETLYIYVLDKLPTTVKDPTEVLDMKMSLAEILLNHVRYLDEQKLLAVGRHANNLKARAEQLFDECSKFHTKQINAGTSPQDIQLRRIIATRYPALIKLDLPNGAVIYKIKDRPGSVCGAICDGRRTDFEGPFDISIIGKGNGRLAINLGGKTLTDLALVQQDAGQLLAAESLLIAALRADPTSESFGLLGECWYLQGGKEKALQAASLALDLDKENAHAASIQSLCRHDLHISSGATPNADSLLKTASSPNSAAQPLTRALALIALNKSSDAVPILTKILKGAPHSYRAATFKAQCASD